MKTKPNLFLLALIIAEIAGLSGCSTILYVPNSENVPLFTAKHQVKAEVNICTETDGFSSIIMGANLQGAYAVTNHLGLMSNLFVAGGEDPFTLEGGSGGLFEAGAGYFLNLSPHLVFEAYGGAGIGWVKHNSSFNSITTQEKVKGHRLFAQPSIGFTSKYFDAAFSLRSCAVFYNNSPSFAANDSSYSLYLLTANNRSAFMMEPAITLRAGFPAVKFQAQFGRSYNLNNRFLDIFFSTMGIFICISSKNKQTSTTGINPN